MGWPWQAILDGTSGSGTIGRSSSMSRSRPCRSRQDVAPSACSTSCSASSASRLPARLLLHVRDLSRFELAIHRDGPAAQWIHAASAPGFSPPMVDRHGDLHVDGGQLNDLPDRDDAAAASRADHRRGRVRHAVGDDRRARRGATNRTAPPLAPAVQRSFPQPHQDAQPLHPPRQCAAAVVGRRRGRRVPDAGRQHGGLQRVRSDT